jgi:hypothetical protein
MLFTKLQFSATTVTLRLAALRFFYIRIEEKLEHRRDTLSKEGASSSGVLIQDEVVRLIDAAYDLGSHRLDGNILDRLALTSH